MTRGISGEAYNLASGHETSIFDWANLIVETSKSTSAVIVKDARIWDNSGRRFGSIVKTRDTTGFLANTSSAVGLLKTVTWTMENRLLIEKSITKHGSKLVK